MKALYAVLLVVFFVGKIAQARVLSVRVDRDDETSQTHYVATIEVCPATYPSVITRVQKLSGESALVEIRPSLDVSRCAGKVKQAGFYLLIEPELKQLGLSAEDSHLFFQLQ